MEFFFTNSLQDLAMVENKIDAERMKKLYWHKPVVLEYEASL